MEKAIGRLQRELTVIKQFGKWFGRDGKMLETVVFTSEQKRIVRIAVEMVRKDTDFKNMTEGRAVELVCANFISGYWPKSTKDSD